jgi:hypothetical protein
MRRVREEEDFFLDLPFDILDFAAQTTDDPQDALAVHTEIAPVLKHPTGKSQFADRHYYLVTDFNAMFRLSLCHLHSTVSPRPW